MIGPLLKFSVRFGPRNQGLRRTPVHPILILSFCHFYPTAHDRNKHITLVKKKKMSCSVTNAKISDGSGTSSPPSWRTDVTRTSDIWNTCNCVWPWPTRNAVWSKWTWYLPEVSTGFSVTTHFIFVLNETVECTDTTCKMLEPRPFDDSDKGFVEWKIKSLQFWGENPFGVWTVCVKDEVNISTAIRVYGGFVLSVVKNQKQRWKKLRDEWAVKIFFYI